MGGWSLGIYTQGPTGRCSAAKLIELNGNMISYEQAFAWGVKAASEPGRPFNPFSNHAARAAWEAGRASQAQEIKFMRDTLISN